MNEIEGELEDVVMTLVRARDHVSFVELDQALARTGIEIGLDELSR